MKVWWCFGYCDQILKNSQEFQTSKNFYQLPFWTTVNETHFSNFRNVFCGNLQFSVFTGLAKNPRTRFKSLIPIVEPSEVASTIIKAVKQNDYEVYIPTRLFYLFSLAHLLPLKVKIALYKFAGCGVGSHE